jgi:hypothetical protein
VRKNPAITPSTEEMTPPVLFFGVVLSKMQKQNSIFVMSPLSSQSKVVAGIIDSIFGQKTATLANTQLFYKFCLWFRPYLV